MSYDGIVLSGGGSKGMIILGALNYLVEVDKLDMKNVTHVAGTSIGSAIGLLLICGYAPMEIYSKLLYIEDLLGVKSQNFANIFAKMGMLTMDTYKEVLTTLVIDKIGHVPTLKELYETTNIHFHITVANITNMIGECYSWENYPDVSVVDAVSYSSAVPFIFEKQISKNGDVVMDGGLVNNYPWNLINNKCRNILGIVLPGLDESKNLESIMGYMYRIVMLPISELTQQKCRNCPQNVDSIEINIQNIPSIQFNLTIKDKEMMFLEGNKYAKEHCSRVKLHIIGL